MIVYHCEVDSCENCPGSLREPYGLYRCKHNTEVTFKQNQDMGIPATCPMRIP